MLDTCVYDIIENKDSNVIQVELEISDREESVVCDTILLDLDLDKVGISKEDDYAFQLCKDLDRIVNRLYNKMDDKDKIPSKEDIENAFHQMNYMSIEIGV